MSRQSNDRLPRDCFGRVKTTHMCPRCGSRYLSPTECRSGPFNDHAHPEGLVPTLPIIGCDEPPDKTYVAALPIGFRASTYEKAGALLRSSIERDYPKRQAETLLRFLTLQEVAR
jgi:hypothetical protein